MKQTPDTAVDPGRPDPVVVALTERREWLARDEERLQEVLARLHAQQDDTTRDLLWTQEQIAALDRALTVGTW